nr:adhesion G-protein coupled receptor V1-like [Anolis sagrei ordinatus]
MGGFPCSLCQQQGQFGKKLGNESFPHAMGKTVLQMMRGMGQQIPMLPHGFTVFLFLGLNFTLELKNITLVNVSAKTVPKISETGMSVSIPVPKEAANSQVAFDSVVLQLTNITAGTTEALIIRKGVYGSITVVWSSGYPAGLNPEYLRPGYITPASGTVIFLNGEQSKTILFHVVPNPSSPEVFAVHLSAVYSNISGGAHLR